MKQFKYSISTINLKHLLVNLCLKVANISRYTYYVLGNL